MESLVASVLVQVLAHINLILQSFLKNKHNILAYFFFSGDFHAFQAYLVASLVESLVASILVQVLANLTARLLQLCFPYFHSPVSNLIRSFHHAFSVLHHASWTNTLNTLRTRLANLRLFIMDGGYNGCVKLLYCHICQDKSLFIKSQ